MARTSFTVTELNAHIKQLLDADVLLGNVCVTGELSNYKVYPSGHHYFTLKDAESSLRCVMFRSSAQSLRFRPASGMSVAAIGRIAVYPRDGAYQLYCTRLIPGGVGDLYAAYEQLKEQLQKEGLFDRAHKKPLPLFPQRIAVITSAAGAAVRDIIRVLGKRWPASEVVLLPVRVQGTEAPAEIAGAIRYANRYRVGDLIITGRGGGSIEDLWAFNDERVARAIYDSPDKNIKLATYASRCIENEILMYLRKCSAQKTEVSIDEPLNTDWDGNELLLSDILGTDADAVSRPLEDDAERAMLLRAIETLGERDRQIILLRFGIGGAREATQKEVADLLGISQSYISRLEKRIIAHLRQEMLKQMQC